MGIEKGIFNRTSLLLGDDVMDNIYQKRVIIFGLGGVGSWCAEMVRRKPGAFRHQGTRTR